MNRQRSDVRFAPIEGRQLFTEALRQITDAIRLGDLAVGDQLPPERVIAEQMNISRPTLRDALKALTDAEVLEARQGGGTFIRSDRVPSSLIAERVRMRVSQVTEVLEARRALEPQIAQLVGRNPWPDDRAALERALEKQIHVGENRDLFLRYEIAFHLGLARAVRNAFLEPLMRRILAALESAFDIVLVNHPYEATIEIHRRTIDAVWGGDAAEIEMVMDEHLSMTEAVWERETQGTVQRLLRMAGTPRAGAFEAPAPSRRTANDGE